MNKKLRTYFVSTMVMALIMGNMNTSCLAQSKKYNITDSGHGYYVVTQDNGKTLTYSKDSGIKILEDDGFAFKDLNKNSKLDTYEDWRLDTNTRATSLAQMMIKDGRKGIESIAGLMLYSAHTTVKSENLVDSTATSSSQDATTLINAVQDNNIRHILVTSIASPEIGAKWNNNLQALCEGMGYGIPANNSSDPRHEAKSSQDTEYIIGNQGAISLWPSSIGLAATFDPEVVKQFGDIASTEYRALGITTALSPQIDLATEPRWSRVSGTFGENSKLSADLSRAYIDGFQTTKGETNGWGNNSVNAMVKHWPSGGPEEGGRDGHYGYGKYAVYPGENFEDHLKPFIEGAFKLDDGTNMASAVMPYYTISYDKDDIYNENVGNGFSKYILTDLLRDKYHYDGDVCTDWMITGDSRNDAVFEGKNWGVEHLTITERHYKALMAGVDQFGGNNVIEPVMGAYDMMVKKEGKEFANERFAESARRLLTNIFNVGLFESPYINPSESVKTVGNSEFMEAGYEAQLKSVVMLKNKDNVISKYDENAEKLTVYVPEYETTSKDWFTGETKTTRAKTISVDILSQYYNVTDDPTKADLAIIGMDAPKGGSGYSLTDKEAGGNGYLPISLQYGKYTAVNAREIAIANDPGKAFRDTETNEIVYVDTVENRSYKGKTTVAENSDMLTLLKETKEKMGDKPVIVYMRASNPMVWAEVEPLADAIIVGYSIQDQAAIEVITGQYEPSGLLPMQQPLNMETVEAQYEDVAQDMACYVDEMGNAYDFAFGLNWSGKISDERTSQYNVMR